MIHAFFLYGTGPAPTDLPLLCRELQLAPAALQSLGPAYLPDLQPLWTANTEGRVQLCAVPGPACALPGLLIQATAAGAQALLDHTPLEWSVLPALTDGGRVVPAWVAQVHPQAAPAVPEARLVEQVQNFLKTWGIDSLPVARAAAGLPVPALCDVFAYGTLRCGEPNAPLLEPASAAPGYMHGKLWSLGAFPVLTPATEPNRVVGELRRCPDLPQRLAELDQLEDFTGYHSASMYWRVLGRVHTAHGAQLAWLWQMDEVPAGALAIPSGDWRDRQVV